MKLGDMVEAAEDCRRQAQAFQGQEQDLLVRVAETFEAMVSTVEIRRTLDATRCW